MAEKSGRAGRVGGPVSHFLGYLLVFFLGELFFFGLPGQINHTFWMGKRRGGSEDWIQVLGSENVRRGLP